MFMSSYFTCGILYSIYVFQKIVNNKEQFITVFEEEFGENQNLNLFLSIMFLTNIISWPMLILKELKDRQDML